MHSTTLFSLRTWSLGMNTLLPPEISININSSSALDELNLRHEAFLDHMKKITVIRFSIIITSVIIAYVRAPLRDDSQDQGLMDAQMLHKHNMRAVHALHSLKYLILSTPSSTNPLSLPFLCCLSLWFKFFPLQPLWSPAWLHQISLLNTQLKPRIAITQLHQTLPANGWGGWQWGFAQNLVPTIKAMGELEWAGDFCPKYVYSRV